LGKAVVDLLRLAPQDANIAVQGVRNVLNSWGSGKFDAELFLDGKAFNPEQVTNGQVTAMNVSGATLMPNARGLPGLICIRGPEDGAQSLTGTHLWR
jgi:hypothetical protein